ncbi:MAG: hypothetical protein M3N93_11180, partial [Acidobacteriota bacterium]|nr:hypothetical protein [Acidobacteriota bacterium]
MKTLLLIAVATVLPVFAQNPNTAVFPGAVATDNNLLVSTDNARTTLAVAINATTTTVVLTTATQFVTPMVISIDNEQLLCLTHVGTAYTCSRGWAGSTAVSHAFLAIVHGNITAWPLNQLSAEVKAIEKLQKTVFILSTGQSNDAGHNDGSGGSTPNPIVWGWNGSGYGASSWT